ncbi:MAG: PD-(D/E)XK nuclease family protein, partial [Myxococcota bacterium]|nr:PD-(D/E)XK nuclease family protein [Myxococcota bacterium]
MARVQIEGSWSVIRETEKALLIEREDGYESWFPRKVVDVPDASGALRVDDWFLDRKPPPPLQAQRLELPRTPPPVSGWRKGALSHSRATVFTNCPRAYHFSYERRVPSATNQALGIGNAVHSALEVLFDCDFEQADPLDYLQALVHRAWAEARSVFEQSKRRRGRWSEERLSEAHQMARWGLEHMTGGPLDGA